LKKSFTITRAEVESADRAKLTADIAAATGSDEEAVSVLRSLERMGDDPSILYYEVSHVSGRRMSGGVASNAWRVRADRGAPATEA
jgi:hypothetical protein